MYSFEDIKKGDKVVLKQKGYTIFTVVAITKTQVTAESLRGNKIRIMKRDGSLVGNKHTYVIPLTADIEAEIEEYALEVQRKRMIKKIQEKLPTLSGENIQVILRYIDEI